MGGEGERERGRERGKERGREMGREREREEEEKVYRDEGREGQMSPYTHKCVAA